MEVGNDNEERREKKVVAEEGENVRFYDAALKKCLEERRGQKSAMVTCKSIVEAFKQRISPSSPTSSSSLKQNPLRPIMRSGRLTDV